MVVAPPVPAVAAGAERGRHRKGRSPQENVRRDLQGMRAVAVLGVVVYHLRASWLPGGFAGVDVFFVLSGFFITGHLLREVAATGSVDLFRFWTRRIRRLLPAATLTLVGTLAAALVVADALDVQRYARDAGAAALFSLNWRLAGQGTSYFADPDPSPYTHYWSLGVEEQFYLLWPVLLLALAVGFRSRLRALRPAVLLTVGTAAVVSFAVAYAETEGAQSYAYFATYSRVWELGLGAALAVVAPRLGGLPGLLRLVLCWGGVAAVVGFYWAAPLDATYPGAYLAIPAVGAAAVIASDVGREGSGVREPLGLALRSAPAQWVGQYSYGWYLWHWGPLVLFPHLLGNHLSPVELWACAAGSLALAVLGYHLVEQPLREARGLVRGPKRRTAALGVALVTVALLGSVGTYALAHYESTHHQVENAAGVALTPQPVAAASELPAPTRDGCEVSLSSDRLSPECRYLPDTGHGDVVLVGDSHAAQWFPAVESIARRERWGLRVWTRASCPLADITKNINGGPGRNCNRWREDVMQRLISARPNLVVVGGYASVVPALYDPGTGTLVHAAAARRLYNEGLQRELRRLQSAAIGVLVIRDNPSFTRSAPQCALAHDGHPAACSAPRARALRTAEDLDAAKAVGAGWVDFTSVFCDAARCHQVVGATLAYRDQNHLTEAMTARLEPQLQAAAERAVARR